MDMQREPNKKTPCSFCGKMVSNRAMHERFCPKNPEAQKTKKNSSNKKANEKFEIDPIINDGIIKMQSGQKIQKNLNASQLREIVEEIKGKLKVWKVEPGYFTMKEGLELLPIGTTSTDMKRVETITKINTQNDLAKSQEDYMRYIYVIGGLAAVMVVAYMVISAYKGG